MKKYLAMATVGLLAFGGTAQAQSPAALAAAALAPSAISGTEEVIGAAASKAAQAIDGKTVKANIVKIKNDTEVKGSITASNNSLAQTGVVDLDNIDAKKVDIRNLTKVMGSVTASNGSVADIGSIYAHGARVDDLLIDQSTIIGGSVRATDGSVVKAGTIRVGR